MSLQYVHLEGNLFTSDHLQRVQAGDKDVPGLTPQDYEVKRLDEEVSDAFNRIERAWGYFAIKKGIASNDPFDVTHEWISDVWKGLGGGPLLKRNAPVLDGKEYAIHYEWEEVPIHIVPHTQELEKGPRGDARGNPHSTLQEYLNTKEGALWGILTNGVTLRILRRNSNNTRPAYLEFDLKGMMSAKSFAEFSVFWKLCHYTRFLRGPDCWLEKWMHESANRGIPARDLLRGAVKNALLALGRGFLRHPKNKALRQRLQKRELTPEDYYRQLLRLVYRLIFLFVTEDRGLLLSPDAPLEAKELYAKYYGTQRLRHLAREIRGTRHHDLYETVKVVMDALKDAKGKPALALPPLNSDLWSRGFIPDLDPPVPSADSGYLENRDLLAGIHALDRIRMEKGDYRIVDYRNLGAEELGSIYESLLEMEASIDVEGRSFRLIDEAGGERKTTGSHYTPQTLIDEVLDHALDPLLNEAENSEKPEEAILALTVCDPTCGSGHFLIAAAHRMALRLARKRTGDPVPAPGDRRRALRDVISHCIYGVDINPMSVELCKVSLWLEAMEPGKPLAYLEHHIKCGNAVLGAFPEYLERGIPDGAYTPRADIDDRDVCRKLIKLNREFPMSARTLENFREDRRRVSDILSAALDRIESMPTATVDQIEAKDREYRLTFIETDEYERYKHAMDAWCAAFSYEKRPGRDQEQLTNVQLIDLLNPDAALSREGLDLIQAETTKDRNRFFHWQLEFPQVFRRGGFTVVVGNPPYKGGHLVSNEWVQHFHPFIQSIHPHYHGKGDAASAFLLRFHELASREGNIGIITTNGINKGYTRTNALAPILRAGRKIANASTELPWPGRAAVIVDCIVFRANAVQPRLNRHHADFISSRLDDLPEVEPLPLGLRLNAVFKGDVPSGEGFIVSAGEARIWLDSDAKNAEVVRPFLTAQDLFNEPLQSPTRFIICFHDWAIERAKKFPGPFAHVVENVKPAREAARSESVRNNWWQFQHYGKEAHRIMGQREFVIVRPEQSETPLFIRTRTSNILANSLLIFGDDSFEFLGLVNSGIHEVWFRKLGSSIKQDIRYTPNTCFETFPLPRESADVAKLGQAFYEAVLAYAEERELALTPIWNLVNSPQCIDKEVEEIRQLRNDLTKASAAAFDMDDIDFRFGYYQDHAGRSRYSMHPEAAEAVYLRLVEVNARQAAGVAVPVKGTAPKLAKGQTKLTGGQRRLPSD